MTPENSIGPALQSFSSAQVLTFYSRQGVRNFVSAVTIFDEADLSKEKRTKPLRFVRCEE